MSKYIVYLEPEKEGGYIVSCPHFPGCVTQGDTEERAVTMIKDAVKGYVFSPTKHKESVPPGIGETVEKIEVVQV